MLARRSRRSPYKIGAGQEDDVSNPTELGRRDFFKNAALGAAGLVGTTAAAGSRRRRAAHQHAGPAVGADADRSPGVRAARAAHHGARPRLPCGGAGCRRRADAGLGLHGGRAEEDRLRLRRHQPRLDLPGPPRVLHQLRPEHRARAADLPARGSGRGDGARLRQGGRQADADDVPRHGRPAALVDGALPGLGRSRAGVRDRRAPPQPVRRDQPAAQRPGHGLDRARLREVRRRGHHARALRRSGHARVSHRDDAADGPGAADGGRGAAGIDGRQPGVACGSPSW